MSTTTDDAVRLLIEERDRLDRAIALLRGEPAEPAAQPEPTAKRRGRPTRSEESRRAQSEKMKAYWAKRMKGRAAKKAK